jgi:hypothetical protein
VGDYLRGLKIDLGMSGDGGEGSSCENTTERDIGRKSVKTGIT